MITDPWKIRDLAIVAIVLPVLIVGIFFAMFYGLGNGH